LANENFFVIYAADINCFIQRKSAAFGPVPSFDANASIAFGKVRHDKRLIKLFNVP